MNDAKYIGLDVHQATISAAVLDSTGKLVMESILETKAATVLQFIHGLRGSLHLTFEEGTCAAWLHDLLKPHVTKVLVCDPRKNALLKSGNKNDRIGRLFLHCFSFVVHCVRFSNGRSGFYERQNKNHSGAREHQPY
jgi:transposase